MLHGLRIEVLLARLLADAGRHVFDNEKPTTMFKRVGYLGVYQCPFHVEMA